MNDKNQFIHNGNGDQVAGDKIISPSINSNKKEKGFWFWVARISLVATIIAVLIAIVPNKKNMNNQFVHNGNGDQVAGDKIVNNFTPQPRTITSIQDQLISELQKYPPENFSVSVANGDTEMINLQQEFIRILQSSGWKCVSSPVITGGIVYPGGITLQMIEKNEANQTLGNFLVQAGLKTQAGITNLPPMQGGRFNGEKVDLAIFIGASN